MGQAFAGSIRLFRIAGIDIFLHWTWFVGALLEVEARRGTYDNGVFNAVEYFALFAIVLIHEFGHAFACRQVGGTADTIVLWPLGGVAFVAPPPRPGALLWSIAAGPLVNVLLIPVTVGLLVAGWSFGLSETFPDGWKLLVAITFINGILLFFNLLPVYPLDGGKILYAVLWFFLDRATSLLVVSLIGIFGAVGFAGLAFLLQNPWFAIMAAFVGLQAAAGFRQARAMARVLSGPRHAGFACPSCHSPPLAGPYWGCDQCGGRFDAFAYSGTCPRCGRNFPETTCPECHRRHPTPMWYRGDHSYPTEARMAGKEADGSPGEGQAW
jgi:Zn-dependent protease